jgi:DNA-binding NarL/FixJ family response regulator
MVRILIIGGPSVFRDSISFLLSSQKDFEVVGIGKESFDAIYLAETLHPDIALVDVSPPYIDGVMISSVLHSRTPAVALILLVDVANDDLIQKTVCNSVAGYVLKDSAMNELLSAIRSVSDGGSYLSSHIAATTLRLFSIMARERAAGSGETPLSQRDTYRLMKNRFPLAEQIFTRSISKIELSIASYIGQGLTNKEIAETMHLKIGTVRNYVSALLHRMGLHDRTQIAVYALSNGLSA